jgi:hypothetical protein
MQQPHVQLELLIAQSSQDRQQSKKKLVQGKIKEVGYR